MKKYYLIFVWGDVEPQVYGAFETEIERDAKALELRRENGEEHGYYPASVEYGELFVGVYTGAYFDDVEPEEKTWKKTKQAL